MNRYQTCEAIMNTIPIMHDDDELARLRAERDALAGACRSALAEINQCQAYNYQHPTLEAASESLRAALESVKK